MSEFVVPENTEYELMGRRIKIVKHWPAPYPTDPRIPESPKMEVLWWDGGDLKIEVLYGSVVEMIAKEVEEKERKDKE